MIDLCRRDKPAFPARKPAPKPKVHVIGIGKKLLIKQTDLIKHLPAVEACAPAREESLSRDIILPPVLFEPSHAGAIPKRIPTTQHSKAVKPSTTGSIETESEEAKEAEKPKAEEKKKEEKKPPKKEDKKEKKEKKEHKKEAKKEVKKEKKETKKEVKKEKKEAKKEAKKAKKEAKKEVKKETK